MSHRFRLRTEALARIFFILVPLPPFRMHMLDDHGRADNPRSCKVFCKHLGGASRLRHASELWPDVLMRASWLRNGKRGFAGEGPSPLMSALREQA